MICNVGGIDRVLRLGVGTGALSLALFGHLSKGKRFAALALAGSGLFTAVTQYCPMSKFLGVNTCEEPQERFRNRLAESEAELAGSGI